jgi:serine/threonine protein phosphatase PrpC
LQDHKPSNPPERERIQNAGGSVMIQRVNGSLAVSRALGDFEYKNVDGKGPTEQLVSPFFMTATTANQDVNHKQEFYLKFFQVSHLSITN